MTFVHISSRLFYLLVLLFFMVSVITYMSVAIKFTSVTQIIPWVLDMLCHLFMRHFVPCFIASTLFILIYKYFLYTYIYIYTHTLYSVQFSLSVMSDSLRPHELQHTRPPCPSPTPRVHPNSCPLSLRCHPTISSSVIPFSSCPQSFPASGSFQKRQLFLSGCQRIGVSASTSVLPMNT